MILLIAFAFVAGLVTILSPCILPILPIVLSGSIGNGKRKPLGIVTGFIGSFTFFTLSLSYIVKTTGMSADALRSVAIVIIALFGLSMITPKFLIWTEGVFSKLANVFPKTSGDSGFFGGMTVGFSLGLLWAPCVGPILASVITLAATSSVNFASILITFAYSVGTAIPMLGITYGGRTLLNRVPLLLSSTQKIQKIFGIVMIITAFGIFFNIDRRFQSFILETFPNYGVGLTKFEENDIVKQALDALTDKSTEIQVIGKPMNDVLDSQIDKAPEFIMGGEWINSQPLTMKELRGKVVLVDFWTYTCINCIRTLPYIKDWNEKYKDKGLVIVGVHTPEFAFEREAANVKKALKDFGITYPVMQDNEYATWNAYDNHYWPAKYLIDKNGKIRDTHFGEGNYNETELFIQKLLKETGSLITDTPNNNAYKVYSKSPESYLGALRIQYLASPERIVQNKKISFTKPSNISLNSFAFTGNWIIDQEFALPEKGATLSYRFDAKSVYLVMKQKNKETTGRVKITLDGKLLDESNQTSESINSIVTISENRLYSLVTLENPGEHLIELEFLDDGIELFAFTFG